MLLEVGVCPWESRDWRLESKGRRPSPVSVNYHDLTGTENPRETDMSLHYLGWEPRQKNQLFKLSFYVLSRKNTTEFLQQPKALCFMLLYAVVLKTIKMSSSRNLASAVCHSNVVFKDGQLLFFSFSIALKTFEMFIIWLMQVVKDDMLMQYKEIPYKCNFTTKSCTTSQRCVLSQINHIAL